MRRFLWRLCIAALYVVFTAVMAECITRIYWLRYEAAEEIPWHFNRVPLPWSEQRWSNCYAQLRVYGFMVATLVVFGVLVQIAYSKIDIDKSSKPLPARVPLNRAAGPAVAERPRPRERVAGAPIAGTPRAIHAFAIPRSAVCASA